MNDICSVLRRQLGELRERIRSKMPSKEAQIETAATSPPSKHRLPTVIGKRELVMQLYPGQGAEEQQRRLPVRAGVVLISPAKRFG